MAYGLYDLYVVPLEPFEVFVCAQTASPETGKD